MDVGGTDCTEFELEEDCADNTNIKIFLEPPLDMISPPPTCIHSLFTELIVPSPQNYFAAPDMVFIDLDNIIYYDPPNSRIPPKPPITPSVVSDTLSSSFEQPRPMAHPVPPQLPLHYCQNSLFPPVSLSQSPTPPVLSFLPPHLLQNAGSCSTNSGYHKQPNHILPNDFDSELVNLDQLEIEHQVTSGTHVNDFNQQRDDCNSDIQVQDLDILYNDTWKNNGDGDSLQAMSEDPQMQDFMAQSNAAESNSPTIHAESVGPSAAHESARTSDLCFNQGPPTADDKGPPTLACNLATDINNTENATAHMPTTQDLCDAQGPVDIPHHNSDSLIETDARGEPANLHASSGHSRGNIGSEELNRPLATENHSTHTKATHESVTQSSSDEMLGGDEEDRLAPCHSPDIAFPSRVSHTAQHGKKSATKSNGINLPPKSSNLYAVAVVIPRVQIPAEVRAPTNHRHGGHPGKRNKRKCQSRSTCNFDSDDPDDGDYVNESDSFSEIGTRAPPAKRQRQTATAKIASAQGQHKAQSLSPDKGGQPNMFTGQRRSSGPHDMETIPIKGFLTRQELLSSVIYTCTFHEDRQPPCLHEHARNPTDSTYERSNKHTKRQLSRRNSLARTTAQHSRFLPDDDKLLVELKERDCLPWRKIAEYFPGRMKNSLQTRYYKKLKNQRSQSGQRAQVWESGSSPLGLTSSSRTTRDAERTLESNCGHSDISTRSSYRQRYGQPRVRRAVDRYSPV